MTLCYSFVKDSELLQRIMALDLHNTTYSDIIYLLNMDSFNKIVSFVLGLVVVIVFLAIITGRFNVKKSFQGFGTNAKLTPTPTFIAVPTPASVAVNQTNPSVNTTNIYSKTPTSIPATGSSTILLSAFISTLSLGIYLKRKK